jgi:hypothetical protein
MYGIFCFVPIKRVKSPEVESMKVAEQDQQRKIRRKASFALLVYDLHTELPIGQILDLSAKGMKLMTEEPVTVQRVYYCRIPLEKKIKGCDEVFFDAECRWCIQSDETSWYNSGYLLRFPSPKNAEIIRELTRIWIADQTGKSNIRYKRGKKKKGFLRRVFGSRRS